MPYLLLSQLISPGRVTVPLILTCLLSSLGVGGGGGRGGGQSSLSAGPGELCALGALSLPAGGVME